MTTPFNPQLPSYFINPGYHASAGTTHPIVDPGTLEPVGTIASVSSAEIKHALDEATSAQMAWKQRDAKSRSQILHRVADAMESRDLRPCATLMTREMGKPYPEAIGEMANCPGVFRYFAEMARDDAGKVAGSTQAGSFQYARYEPLGTSVHILPFNFPILLMCWTVAASLAAGNACIVKPAMATTLSTLAFMPMFDAIPDGLIACLPGDVPVATALLASEQTHAVAFTGSVAAGKSVAVAAASEMKPAVIEAGGSDAMIISDSAPLDVAVSGAVTAAFHLSGQVCTSTEKIYVVDSAYDAFVKAFVTATRQLRIGHGLGHAEIGPLVSEAARDRVMALVDDARHKGATVALGGKIPPDHTVGWFYEPTILTDVTRDMAVMTDECFGPLVSVHRVKDFNDALTRANDSRFGLGASVFTTRLDEAHDAAERLETGMVWVNNPLIDNDALPFGGWKQSGIGRELSRLGLDAFRRSKMVVLDHKPVIHEWWYPYPDDWFYNDGGRGHG